MLQDNTSSKNSSFNSSTRSQVYKIRNHAELLLQIDELRHQKKIQEEELLHSVTKLSRTFNLFSFFHRPKSENNEFDIVKLGLNTALDLVIEIAMGNHRNVKGFFKSMMSTASSKLLVDNNLGNLILGIIELVNARSSNKNIE